MINPYPTFDKPMSAEFQSIDNQIKSSYQGAQQVEIIAAILDVEHCTFTLTSFKPDGSRWVTVRQTYGNCAIIKLPTIQ